MSSLDPGIINLPAPPISEPYTDEDGMLTFAWQQWFQSQRQLIVGLYGTLHVTTVTSSQTINNQQVVILSNTDSGPAAITLTLPDPHTVYQNGISRSFYIKNSGTLYSTFLDGNGAMIDGSTDQKEIVAGGSRLVVTDGINWFTFVLDPTNTINIGLITNPDAAIFHQYPDTEEMAEIMALTGVNPESDAVLYEYHETESDMFSSGDLSDYTIGK